MGINCLKVQFIVLNRWKAYIYIYINSIYIVYTYSEAQRWVSAGSDQFR